MSWDTTMPIMVRSAIGDSASPPKYSDDQLLPVILTAAYVMAANITLATDYTIDIENINLVPDPFDVTTSDPTFVYLTILKTTVMLLLAEVRAYGQQAIAIRDGTSAIDLKRDLKALAGLADSYSKELDAAISFALRRAGELNGRMIVSPYQGLVNRIDSYFHDSRSCRHGY